MIYKKDSLTSCLWEGTLYDMLKSAIRGHWDKIILDKSRASPVDCPSAAAGRCRLHNVIESKLPAP